MSLSSNLFIYSVKTLQHYTAISSFLSFVLLLSDVFTSVMFITRMILCIISVLVNYLLKTFKNFFLFSHIHSIHGILYSFWRSTFPSCVINSSAWRTFFNISCSACLLAINSPMWKSRYRFLLCWRIFLHRLEFSLMVFILFIL